MLQSSFYLTTAVHISGVTTTHLQEHKTTVNTASGNRYTELLSAAIVEELELIGNQFQLSALQALMGRASHIELHHYTVLLSAAIVEKLN
jgi:hypothetical protein